MSLTIKQTRVVTVPVTELRAAIDMACVATILDAEGVVVGQSMAPSWLPQVLQIDLESGRIVNWRAPTGDQLQAMADGQAAAVATPEPERPYTILDLMRDNAPEAYEAEMRRRAGEPVLHLATTTPEITQPVETVVPVPVVAVEIAPEGQQPKTADHGWVAGLVVSVTEKAGKWSATTGHHTATSAQGKFEAINGVLSKAGMGRCEINQQKDENGHPIEGMYLADDARTKDRTTIYVSGHEIGKGHTARTSVGGKKYTAPTESAALDGLLSEVLKIELPADAIVDTTDDEMVFNDKQRFSIDMTKAAHLPEAATEAIAPAPAAQATATEAAPTVESIVGLIGLADSDAQLDHIQRTYCRQIKDEDARFELSMQVVYRRNQLIKMQANIVPEVPASYSELIAAIEYAPTLIQAAALVNRINAHQDYEQRNALHAALQKRIDALKAAA